MYFTPVGIPRGHPQGTPDDLYKQFATCTPLMICTKQFATCTPLLSTVGGGGGGGGNSWFWGSL